MQSRTVQCDTRSFTVHELTIDEVRAWYANLSAPLGAVTDILNETALPEITLSDLALICHCDVTEFDPLYSRELEAVFAAAKALNPHFFRLRMLVSETMQKMLEAVTVGFPSATAEAV